MEGRGEGPVLTGFVVMDSDDCPDRDWSVHVRKPHRRRVCWVTRFPADRRRQLAGVDLEQHHVGAAAYKRVGGKVDLLCCRAVDKADTAKAFSRILTACLGVSPVLARAEVQDRHHGDDTQSTRRPVHIIGLLIAES